MATSQAPATASPPSPHTVAAAVNISVKSTFASMSEWLSTKLIPVKRVLSLHEKELQEHTDKLLALEAAVGVPAMAKHGVLGSVGVTIDSVHTFMRYHTQLQNEYVLPLLARLRRSNQVMIQGLRQLEAAVDAGQPISKRFFVECIDLSQCDEGEANEDDRSPYPGETPVNWAHRLLPKQSPDDDAPITVSHPYSNIFLPRNRRVTKDHAAAFRSRKRALAAQWAAELSAMHQTSIENSNLKNERDERQVEMHRIGSSEDGCALLL